MKKLVGIVTSFKNGKQSSTIHYIEDFDDFYISSKEYKVIGQRAKSLYVGAYDVSTLPLGSEIEIYYGEYISLPNNKGFQPIKKIEVIK